MSVRFTPALFQHAQTLLSGLLRSDSPADRVVADYFREHRELGHGDRGFVAEAVFTVLRHKRSLAARCAGELTSRRLLLAALACLQGMNRRQLDAVLSEAERHWLAHAKAVQVNELPAAVRLDLPDWLYESLQARFADDELAQLATALKQPAPLDLRINPLKAAGRQEVLARLQADGLAAEACRYSPLGIRLARKTVLGNHPLFTDGGIEVQDEGSQLLGFLLQPRRGEMVVDFCAGAGGKTLLLGALMRSQGRLYAFDVAERRLARLKPRLARSGLSNVHPVRIESERDIKIRRLAGKVDRVLVDAPCSGLGTLRRNPALKWRQTPAGIADMSVRQGAILAAAASLIKKGGRLVYATCSLLDAENEAVVDAFLAQHPQFVVCPAQEILDRQDIAIDCGDHLRLLPHRHATDAFYAVAMERK
ncbi:MAG: RsmB/NOP family class I SAM-dependent RNA methyltransferase [Candidatus Accumulibacter sp.]|uniref:RsmB/NOP family class I SAM-dependent RNA methyltransferase n=1 Tax=Accumulibacter sp. TaxID=2053492 RepID=UPI0025ED5BAA|nr:RsmB/NOP family class I SAM-dependent RNA methyltransferase [Accumulibacter sp.]MCP5247904.1 RsmB/NOP family class I SAM-dependent RNA methyltransferase [Accumulibacter sp.]